MNSSIFLLAVFLLSVIPKKTSRRGGTENQAKMKREKLLFVNFIFLPVISDGIVFYHYLTQAYTCRQEYVPAAARQRRHLSRY